MARAFTGNLGAFLDAIAVSEIGRALIAASDDGYNIIVGSTPVYPVLMVSYADHPRRLVRIAPHLESTAAGRYQILERTFDAYKARIGLLDFSPVSQDKIAAQMISERPGADAAISAGDFPTAISAVCNLWASLPGAGYHQHEQTLVDLEQAYRAAGGIVA